MGMDKIVGVHYLLCLTKLFNNCLFTIWLAPRTGKMAQIARCHGLTTRAGRMEPSCPLGTARCIPQEKFPRKLYNKSITDQVCWVTMGGYWSRSVFASLWARKKELGQYPAILTSHLVNNPHFLRRADIWPWSPAQILQWPSDDPETHRWTGGENRYGSYHGVFWRISRFTEKGAMLGIRWCGLFQTKSKI